MYAVAASAIISAASAAASSEAQRKSASKAAGGAANASMAANNMTQAMYDTARNDFRPFMAPSERAMAELQSAIFGGPVNYRDGSYREMTAEEVSKYNTLQDDYKQFLKEKNQLMYQGDLGGVWKTTGGTENFKQRLEDLNKKYGMLGNKTYYMGADGSPVTERPWATAEYKPQESEGFKYIKDRTLADLGRQLRMIGRGNSTVAANAYGRTLGDLNYRNEQDQKNELWNLVKTAQGATGDISTLGANASTRIGGNLINAADVAGNAALYQGRNQSNLYQGLATGANDFINSDYAKKNIWGG
jgi:hypothetical protein